MVLLIDEVDLPVYIVALRVIGSKVSSPALFPAQRRRGDERRDRGQIAMAPAVDGPRERLRRRSGQRRRRRNEAAALAKQTHRLPHQRANVFGGLGIGDWGV